MLIQLSGLLGLWLYVSSALAGNSPASTDYVKAAVAMLRQDMESLVQTKVAGVEQALRDLPLIRHHLGEIFQGGRIFWVDESQQHGLMVALEEPNAPLGLSWCNGEGGDKVVNAQSLALGAGEANTRLIVAQQTIDQQDGQFAALAAQNYQVTAEGKSQCEPTREARSCYGGWYLPSLQELLLLYTGLKSSQQPMPLDKYWSSSEVSTTQAYLVDFATGQVEIAEKSSLARVLAIRTF